MAIPECKVTDFDTSRKPICDFPLVNKYKLTSHFALFASYCTLLVKIWLSIRGYLSLTHPFAGNSKLRTMDAESLFLWDYDWTTPNLGLIVRHTDSELDRNSKFF